MANDKKVTISIGTDVDLNDVHTLEDLLQAIEDDPITPQIDDTAAQIGIQNLKEGFESVKQSAGELKEVVAESLESAGRMEQMEGLLTKNMGESAAKSTIKNIRAVTDSLPGDDVSLQNLLSQAAMKDATVDFQQMGSAAADYMAAMTNYGKNATETQQDLMNYILAGNTAEVQRSPVLQAHIDKLKEGNTIQERSLLLQQALKEEGFEGIANLDIYNNKQQQFNDMLERGKINMGNLFLTGTEGAMGFLMDLDNATGGLVGMTAAMGEMASPLFSMVTGLGQLSMGLQALKINTIAQTLANWGLNASLLANPALWVAVAIIALTAAFIWAYQNVDWFREMVDNAVGSIVNLANTFLTTVQSAINGFNSAIQAIPAALQACLDWAYNLIMSHPVVQAAVWLGQAIASGFSALGLGQHSPGKIVQSMNKELDWTEKAMLDSNLSDTSTMLGSDISNSFNPDMNGNSGGYGNNITINIENVDNEDRIQQIVEAVEQALAFDNLKAGRTV